MKTNRIYSSALLIAGSGLAVSMMNSCSTDKNQSLHDQLGFTPNILCLVCEDISSYLGCYGDDVAYTPVLDELAEEGIMFTNVFSVAGVCAPSRAALITGMYPTSFGASNMRTNRKDLPELKGIPPYEATPGPEVKCYTEYMRAAGYYCTNNEKEDYQFNAPGTAWDESSRFAHWRNRPEGKPFFAIFNFMKTHESQIWNWLNEPKSVDPADVVVPPIYPDNEVVRRDIATLYSNITVMDREVGEVLSELKEDGLLDSTIVIFYSDHGGPMPRGKREILDTGLKVPMIIRMPGKLNAGTVNDELVSFVDIPATILSLADVNIPEYMHGQAFMGDQEAPEREYIYAARDRMDGQTDCRRAVRDKEFKYIRNYMPEVGAYLPIKFRFAMPTMGELWKAKEAGTLNEDQMYWFRETKEIEELYDINADPYEFHNLAGLPEYAEKLKEMREVHEKWMKDISDPGPLHEKDMLYLMWPEGIQPETSDPEISVVNGEIEINCPTPGASIEYQVNGRGLNEKHTFLYTGSFKVKKGDVISAKAYRIGFKPSEKTEFVY